MLPERPRPPRRSVELQRTEDMFLSLMVRRRRSGTHIKVWAGRTADLARSSRHGASSGTPPLTRDAASSWSAGMFSFEVHVETVESLPIILLLHPEAVAHAAASSPAAVIGLFRSRRAPCRSDLLVRMAQGKFERMPRGGGRGALEWSPSGSTGARRIPLRDDRRRDLLGLLDTATERIGVCRDFAHLVIAFCRSAASIGACRLRPGYALGLDPPDFHSFVEVYLSPARRHSVDATTADLRPALVPIAVGRNRRRATAVADNQERFPDPAQRRLGL